ncbi:PblA [uncultured Granulicatella sp.]|uniref:phage tail protein n=1 Tax=uncultured Granulicatella sp. TaxID=316089 RepID=UPI00260CC117|nr:PblA [uncultured Granulicatella sp.]
MATELGAAYVQIIPSAQGIKGMIQKAMGSEVASSGQEAGTSFMSGFKGAALKIAAALGIGAAIKTGITAALSEGASLQQSLGGIETLFKDNATQVIKYADEAYKTTGLSANAYMENVTGFSASLLQSLGGDTAKAAEVANMAMIDMADNSNKMGTSMESIQTAYQGFAKQNYTMLDNLKLGYGGTKEEMQRLLRDAEKLTGTKYDINNLNDVYQAIHAIQDNLDITGTTAKEASTTFTGSFNAMKAAAHNLLGDLALGEDVEPALIALADTAKTFFVDNFLPMLWNVVKGVPDILESAFELASAAIGENLGSIMDSIPELLQMGSDMVMGIYNSALEAIPGLLNIVSDIVNGLVESFMQNWPSIFRAGTDFVFQLIDGLVQAAPGILQAGIDLISSLLQTIYSNAPQFISSGFEVVTNLISGIIQRIPGLVDTGINMITNLVTTIWNNLPQILNAGVQIISSLIKGLVQMIPKVLGKIGEMGGNIVSSLGKIDLWAAGKAIIDGFLGGIKAAFEGVKNFVGGIANWIAEHKGPISYDRRLLIPHGNAIMDSLQEGLQLGFKDVKTTVQAIAEDINEVVDKYLDNQVFNDVEIGSNVAVAGGIQLSKQQAARIGAWKPEQYRYDTEPDNNQVVEIHTTVELDGKVVGKQITPYVTDEQTKHNRREQRKRGER